MPCQSELWMFSFAFTIFRLWCGGLTPFSFHPAPTLHTTSSRYTFSKNVLQCGGGKAAHKKKLAELNDAPRFNDATVKQVSHLPDSWLLQTIRSLCDVDPEDLITQMYRPENCQSRGTSGSVELHKMLFFLTGLSAAPWKFKSVADLVSVISTYQCIVIPDGTQ